MPIKLAIADDHRLFIEGMRMIIQTFPNVELIIEAENGQQLLEAVKREVPDVVLLDIKMPIMDGIEATKLLRTQYPKLGILLLTLHDNERLISHLMELGANGYLLKNEHPKTVLDAINCVYNTGFYFNDYVGKALLAGLKSGKRPSSADFSDIRKPAFSRRELEVLQLICQQHTTAEIAKLLYITPRTVEGHRKNLLIKSEARNLAGLVIFAMQNKLVDIPKI